MKISYRTHPILEKITNDSIINEIEDYEIKALYNKSRNAFIEQVTFVSDAFFDAMLKSIEKLKPVFTEVWDIGNLSGMMIIKGSAYMMNVKIDEVNGSSLVFFKFSYTGDLISYQYKDYANNNHVDNWWNCDNDKKATDIAAVTYLFCMLFKKYAPVETKFIPAHKKVKDFNCKYVNDTNFDISYMDSTWFTNLVKSDAFKVRGHFRLQPCGQGFKDKKLIWINDFEKQGYTRQAGKIKEYGI